MSGPALEPVAPHFVARPRRAGVRVLKVCIALLMVLAGLLLGTLFLEPGRVGGPPAFLEELMVALGTLNFLVLAAALHAQLGAQAGRVPSLWQLWRNPALRDLPELPPLPRWKLALCYGVPLLAMAGLFGLQSQISARMNDVGAAVQDEAQLEPRAVRLPGFPMIQLDCAAVPLLTTAQSRCFILSPRAAQPDPQRFLDAWTDHMRAWVDWSGPEPVWREALPLTLKVWQGGGFAGADQRVALRVRRGNEPQEVPVNHRLLFLSRTAQRTGSVPPASRALADWLGRQVFQTLLVMTPED